MKFNKWTVGLAAVGVVSLASAARADEQMSAVNTALSQTTLSGYVDTAMQYNPGTDNRGAATYPGHVPGYSFAKDDGFSLNAVDVALDKPEDSSQWAAGYHIEAMYGADAVGIAPGAVSASSGGTTTTTTVSQVALRQAFIRLHTPVGGNGIDWQIGVWDSIIGYESNSDPLNPNYTRSYAYTMEPTTFTGILGTYKVNDEVSFSAGIANDEFVNSSVPGNTFESGKAYMASVSLTAPDSMGFLKGATFSSGFIHNADSVTGSGTTTSFYAGATVPTPINSLKVGGSFDYLWEQTTTANTAITGIPGGIGEDVWDLALYGTVQATDKLSFNFRGEYLDNGAVVHGALAVATTSTSPVYMIPPGQDIEELTATIQYNLWANVMTRGEFRWDHAAPFGHDYGLNAGSNAFRKNDFLLALNVIYQF
jgi:Putative beta-barrel porin-2, OmpL-like. bbp2